MQQSLVVVFGLVGKPVGTAYCSLVTLQETEVLVLGSK
jgi:hypothetical protein